MLPEPEPGLIDADHQEELLDPRHEVAQGFVGHQFLWGGRGEGSDSVQTGPVMRFIWIKSGQVVWFRWAMSGQATLCGSDGPGQVRPGCNGRSDEQGTKVSSLSSRQTSNMTWRMVVGGDIMIGT